LLDIERAGSNQMTLADISEACGDDIGRKCAGVRLPVPDHPVVSGQLSKDEVLPAKVGWRITNDDRVDFDDLQ
jgi:hypothetical protein